MSPRFFVLAALLLSLATAPLPAQPTGILYWTDIGTGHAWRAHTDGSQVKTIGSFFSPNQDLVVDTLNGKLYFTVVRGEANQWEIWRADLDGRHQESVISPATSAIRGLVLDPAGGRIYWTEGALLRGADLDGADVETLFTSLDHLNGLALDPTADPVPRLWFIDSPTGASDQIRSVRLDGTDVQTHLEPGLPLVRIAVDEANDRLFLATPIISDSLYRVGQDGTGLVSLGIDAPNAHLAVAVGRLYFDDDTLESVDLDGNDRQTELTASGSIFGFALDVYGNQAYVHVGQIHRIGLDGSDETALIGLRFSNVHDLAVATDGTLYLAMAGSDRITKVDRGTGDVLPLLASRDATLDIRGIALHPGTETLYWASLGGWVARLGTDGSDLVQLLGESKPHDVAVDQKAGVVYWTDNIGDSGAPDTTGVLRKAGLDLMVAEDVVTGLPRQIRGLDVDDDTGQIYFTDHGTDQIRRVDSDGTGLVDVVPATNPHDVVVDETGRWIYWTEGFSDTSDPNGAIRRFPIAGPGTAEDVVTGLSSFVRDLTLVYLPGEVFEDDFESGETSEWASTR